MNTEETHLQTLKRLELLVEQATGRSVADIRGESIDNDRAALEKRMQHRTVFTRKFPFIGRGCIMGDRAKSRQEIDRLLEQALH